MTKEREQEIRRLMLVAGNHVTYSALFDCMAEIDRLRAAYEQHMAE